MRKQQSRANLAPSKTRGKVAFYMPEERLTIYAETREKAEEFCKRLAERNLVLPKGGYPPI